MGRPSNKNPTVRGGKILLHSYIDEDLYYLLIDSLEESNLTYSEWHLMVVYGWLEKNRMTKRDIDYKYIRSVVEEIKSKINSSDYQERKERKEVLSKRVETKRVEEEQKKSEEQIKAEKEAQQKAEYEQSIYENTRKFLIRFYRKYCIPLKQIELKKEKHIELNGDEQEVLFSDIKFELQNMHILKEQRDLKYERLIEIMNTITEDEVREFMRIQKEETERHQRELEEAEDDSEEIITEEQAGVEA